MVTLSITSQVQSAVGFVGAVAKQVPFAQREVLNDLAFEVRRAYTAEAPRRLKKPTPWIAKAWRVKRASFQDQNATVYVADEDRFPYWEQVIEGGTGVPRDLERQQRLPQRGQQLVASHLVKRNRYRNVAGGRWFITQERLIAGRVSHLARVGTRPAGLFDYGAPRLRGKARLLRALFWVRQAKRVPGRFPLRVIADPILRQYPARFQKALAEKTRIAAERAARGKR